MKRKLSLRQLQQPKNRFGQFGEQTAATFLQQQNYQLIAHNIRWKHLECDLIAVDPQTSELVFIEVKTRLNPRNTQQTPAHLAITPQKLRSLYRFASIFISKTKWHNSYRLDLITVTNGEVAHFRNISWWI